MALAEELKLLSQVPLACLELSDLGVHSTLSLVAGASSDRTPGRAHAKSAESLVPTPDELFGNRRNGWALPAGVRRWVAWRAAFGRELCGELCA